MADPKRDAATSRIIERSVELLVEFDMLTIEGALAAAEYEDRIIYGDPDAPTPRGILSA